MNLSFIKLDINILNDEKIKIVRKYPDGDKLLIMWIGLMCLGMKSSHPGYLYISEKIPYTDDDLAVILDLDKKVIEMGIGIFKRLDMIDLIEGGIIEIVNFERHQELEKIEKAKRISRASSNKYREDKKNILLKRSTDKKRDSHVTKSDDTDKDKDKDKDKDIKPKENIKLKEKEMNSLIENYGHDNTHKLIEYLSLYKIEKGYKTKSDYLTILRWVVDACKVKPFTLPENQTKDIVYKKNEYESEI